MQKRLGYVASVLIDPTRSNELFQWLVYDELCAGKFSTYFLTLVMTVRLSVLSACRSAGFTGRIYVKFDSGDFYENMSRNSKYG